MSNQFKQGCGECCDMGFGPFCLTCCCPCIAFYQAAEDIGDPNGVLYLIGGLLGFNCCMLCILGDKVAEQRNIPMGICMSGVMSCFDCCTCYSCSVVAEAKDIKNTAGSAPAATQMTGRQ